jgi:uncharacterized iron-regulated membrane protein
MRAETDYAKLSLYLGVLSVVGAGAYWWWQRERAEAEARYERKYRESKQAIAEVQAAFGLQPTGHLDALTRSILLGLAKERLPRGLPNSAFEG